MIIAMKKVMRAGRATSAKMERVREAEAFICPTGVRLKAIKPRAAPMAPPIINDDIEPMSTPSTLPTNAPPMV